VLFHAPGRDQLRHLYRIATGAETVDGTYEVAVLGDSTAQGGQWHRLLDGRRIGNFGRGGEEVGDVARRAGEVIAARPRIVFVLAGINDLLRGRDPAAAADDLAAVIDPLRAAGITVSVNALFCGNAAKAAAASAPFVDCARVRAFNERARAVAAAHGAAFIDLAPALMSGDETRAAFTDDGLHLNEAGSRVVAGLWRGYLE